MSTIAPNPLIIGTGCGCFSGSWVGLVRDIPLWEIYRKAAPGEFLSVKSQIAD